MKKLSLAATLLICACDSIVDIDIPFNPSQLTVNSLFNPDSLWTARVTSNRHILDTTKTYGKIDNALLIIYNDNNPIDTLSNIGNGNYRSDTGKPLVGETYEIRASSGNFQSVSASTYIPSPALINSVEIKRNETP